MECKGSRRVAINSPSSSLLPASGRSYGSTVAWGSPLRRQTRRLEVVRRSLPRSVPALLIVDDDKAVLVACDARAVEAEIVGIGTSCDRKQQV
jgi:hypothetical protein